MKFLYIGGSDTFSKHELGFIASLKLLGDVDVIVISSDIKGSSEKLKVMSDNNLNEVKVLKLGIDATYRLLLRAGRLLKALKEYLGYYDAIFATPREPLVFSIALRRAMKPKPPIILRLWSIRAAKLKDNLRFGAYDDVAIFLPSVIANGLYIALSNASITLDHATHSFAKLVYPFYVKKLYRVYPPYGYVYVDGLSKSDEEVISLIDPLNDYILILTTLSKHGPYLKFEARPHAIAAYSLAHKLRDTDVVLAGSSYEDWVRVFPEIKPPKNLHFIGRGFSDQVLEILYRKARLVVVPVTNRNISNRLLEALFFSRPVLTSEVVRFMHPELEHGKHLYISRWDNIVEEIVRVVNDDTLLSQLEEGSRDAYVRYFSTKVNALSTSKILGALKR
ncbi:glycosyltransferase [Candidatus Bathyarchaeota archaeon]|nr:glycosyltransferase [Candidatus Bathyarchaeota archaeon]